MANTGHAKFLEVEYKFVLPDEATFEHFCSLITTMSPSRHSHVSTTDTYYVLDSNPGFIYRHRFDQELQQLTVKSLTQDPSVRMEVNLELKTDGNQGDAVQNFLQTFGIKAQSSLTKDLYVFYFPNIEIALYRARAGQRELLCLEIEVTNFDDISSGKNELNKWCQKIGVNSEARETRSLFEILLLPSLT